MPSPRSVIFDIVGRDNLSPALARASKSSELAATRIDRSLARIEARGVKMQAVGQRLSKSLTLPIVGLGAVAVHEAMQYQKSMTLLQTAGGETAAKMKIISKGVKQVAKDTGSSLDQLGEGMYTIAKAGAQKWSAVDQLKVLKVAAQGAKAENVDLGVATDALSTVMLDYHLSASKAVQTENQLIRASGLAKTSFSLFSTSLSNVLPIAAALGVSIPQVTGSLATMTQHGVSAQQASENMRNLLFNLSGQNNVASQAMQQLGIDTVDLARNLGRRGLTGTLAIVDKAMKDHTRNGMVVVDVHKAAALATRSLGTMMGSFNGTLKKQSQGLLKGSVDIAGYTKYAKSLGGQAGAGALQFLALYKNSQGFSNQLRSGKGTITTTTSQYQKLLGGMTGASVAMQIAGKYAKENARNVREVGKASLLAGSDVLGWGETQDTLAVKMDKAKASLQVLAVEVGTKLIPVVSKIVDKVSDGVEWFDKLSGTDKKMIGWSVGILAAAGPVLAITGRLTRGITTLFKVGAASGRFIAGMRGAELSIAAMNTRSYTSGLAMTRNFQGIGASSGVMAGTVGKAARATGAALGGAAIGYGIGQLTQNASTGAKAVGALASAGLGAATGFAVGGPLGAAVGGAAGLLSNLATNFFGASDAAKQAVKPTDDFTAAILRDNDALGKNTRLFVSNDLSKKGTFDAGRAFGLDPRTLTSAVLGAKDAKAKIAAALKGIDAKSLGIAGGRGEPHATDIAARLLGIKPGTKLDGGMIDKLRKFARQAAKLRGDIGDETAAAKVNKKAADDIVQANSAAGKAESARKTALKEIPKLSKAAASSLNGLNVAVGTYGATLRAGTEGGDKNNAILRGSIESYNALARAQFNTGSSMSKVLGNLESNTTEFRKQAVAAGFNGKAIDALIARYRLTPKQIVTQMVANIDKGVASADQLQTVINSVRQGQVPGLSADSSQALAIIRALQKRIDELRGKTVTVGVVNTGGKHAVAAATGGQVFGPGTSTSDSIDARLSNGEFVVRAKRARKHLRLLHAINSGPGFKDGGQVGLPSGVTTGSSGGKTVYLYDGIEYKSLSAAKNARARAAKRKSKADASLVDTAISGVGQTSSPAFQVADVGIGRIGKQLDHATDVLNQQIARGLSKALTSKYRRELGSLRKLAERQLAALRVKIRTSDVADLRTALKGTVDDTCTAVKALTTDLRNAGVSAAKIQQVAQKGQQLVNAQDRQSNVKDYTANVRSTLSGSFDGTQYGSIDDLVNGLSAATGTNNTYAAELTKLRGETKGDKKLQAYINDLAEKGQTTTLATLAAGSKADLARVAQASGAYDSSLAAGSDAAAVSKYGTTQAQASKDVQDLVAAIGRLAGALGSHAAKPAVLNTDDLARHTNHEIARAVSGLTRASKRGVRHP